MACGDVILSGSGSFSDKRAVEEGEDEEDAEVDVLRVELTELFAAGGGCLKYSELTAGYVGRSEGGEKKGTRKLVTYVVHEAAGSLLIRGS